MPSDLKEAIDRAAIDAGRSINSEIVDRLRRSFAGATSDLASIADGVLLDEVIARYGARVQIVIAQDVADRAGISPAKPKRRTK